MGGLDELANLCLDLMLGRLEVGLEMGEHCADAARTETPFLHTGGVQNATTGCANYTANADGVGP